MDTSLLLGCLLSCLSCCLTAVEAPSGVREFSQSEHRWLGSLGGVHAAYTVREHLNALPHHAPLETKQPTDAATSASWSDVDGSRYRYETHVNAGLLNAALAQYSWTLGIRSRPRMTSSSPAISWSCAHVGPAPAWIWTRELDVRTLPKVIAPNQVLPSLASEANAQTVLSLLITGGFDAMGYCGDGAHVNPFAPMPTFVGVNIDQVSATPLEKDHARLSFRIGLPRAHPL